MSPEEMMKKAMEAATPGESHKRLEALVGNWTTSSKMWMDPTKAPEVSKGSAKHQLILGKRFLKEEYKGTFAGKPFTGNGLLGYDNVKGKYISLWYDSMSTGVMSGEGDYKAASNEIEMSNRYSCPMTGGEVQSRTVTRFVNKNEFVFEMYSTGPDGKEVKAMEIVYKRAH